LALEVAELQADKNHVGRAWAGSINTLAWSILK